MTDASDSGAIASDLAKRTSPKDVSAYLQHTGWLAQPAKSRQVIVWTKWSATEGETRSVTLPVDESLGDFNSRFVDALSEIAEFEERSLADVVEATVPGRFLKLPPAVSLLDRLVMVWGLEVKGPSEASAEVIHDLRALALILTCYALYLALTVVMVFGTIALTTAQMIAGVIVTFVFVLTDCLYTRNYVISIMSVPGRRKLWPLLSSTTLAVFLGIVTSVPIAILFFEPEIKERIRIQGGQEEREPGLIRKWTVLNDILAHDDEISRLSRRVYYGLAVFSAVITLMPGLFAVVAPPRLEHYYRLRSEHHGVRMPRRDRAGSRSIPRKR